MSRGGTEKFSKLGLEIDDKSGYVRKNRPIGVCCMTHEQFNSALGELGYSQVEFADKIGVNGRTVRKWALDETRIPGPVVVLLNLLLSRPELVQVVNEMPPPDVRERAD